MVFNAKIILTTADMVFIIKVCDICNLMFQITLTIFHLNPNLNHFRLHLHLSIHIYVK